MVQRNSQQGSAPRSQDGAATASTLDAEDARILNMSSTGLRLLDEQRKRIARLEADLEECREFIEAYVDVNDGDYGEPAPNRAMQLVSLIDETLNGRPY